MSSNTSAGISRHYIFDPGGRVIYETRVGGGSGGGSNPTTPPDTSYIFAFGQHLAKVAGTIDGGGEISYYHNDQLGSPMAMTDKTGKVIWSQDYLPYGEDLNENPQGGDTRFKFNGKEQDEATGLYYYNARWYDSELGRFITVDPIKSGTNWYIYTLNNPLKFIDPTGQKETLGATLEEDTRMQRNWDLTKNRPIAIDAGHGGLKGSATYEPGTFDPCGRPEEIYTLDFSKRLKEDLDARGYNTAMVGNMDDKKKVVKFPDRGPMANRLDASIYTSIHFNSSGKMPEKASGFEVLVSPKGSTERFEKSKTLAQNIYEAFGFSNYPERELKVTGKYAVLNSTKMPAVIAEIGFLHSDRDYQYIQNKDWLEAAAEQIAKGIDKFFHPTPY